MIQGAKPTIVIGETGHRNIVEEDKAEIKARVIDGLKEIQSLCGGTPIVMLNAFAQGADMLCAEAAFELGIDVIAVLPRDENLYIDSFDDVDAKGKLFDYLAKCKRKIIAPDIEKSKEWLKNTFNIDDDSYEYRQLGIYMAEHSDILLALWDGKPPKGPFGCGTAEVIQFALEHNYLDPDRLAKPSMANDRAVMWIKSRRQGDLPVDIERKWLVGGLGADGEQTGYVTSDDPQQLLRKIISNAGKRG